MGNLLRLEGFLHFPFTTSKSGSFNGHHPLLKENSSDHFAGPRIFTGCSKSPYGVLEMGVGLLPPPLIVMTPAAFAFGLAFPN